VFAPIGITGNLYLQGTHPTDIAITLESVNVASYQTSSNQWRVDVLLSSSNDPFVSQLNFVLQNTSFTYQSNITFNQHVSLSLWIPNDTVQLWWPNGYGNQTLYTLSVYNQGQLIGSRLIGFRTVELAQHTYGPNIKGLSFYFVINGHPMFAKGSNWVPPDAFHERLSDERLERLLRSAQLANMNILRVSGAGVYESDSFYEMTDRLGIMVWHDFMFACSL
jgi:beta-mannosidase